MRSASCSLSSCVAAQYLVRLVPGTQKEVHLRLTVIQNPVVHLRPMLGVWSHESERVSMHTMLPVIQRLKRAPRKALEQAHLPHLVIISRNKSYQKREAEVHTCNKLPPCRVGLGLRRLPSVSSLARTSRQALEQLAL
uniref:Uncharacterized protein n=1 Tax=Hemiselmis andersenii TaxID=464988 RepID=A0A7S0U4M0_HEMAN